MSEDFIIRWAATDPGSCILCREQVGTGPIGWRSTSPAGPVCDACLSDHCSELAALLRLVNLARELADAPRTVAASLAFRGAALSYHTRASWPLRPAGFGELVERVVAIFDEGGQLCHLPAARERKPQ